jgi:hypothetical protein
VVITRFLIHFMHNLMPFISANESFKYKKKMKERDPENQNRITFNWYLRNFIKQSKYAHINLPYQKYIHAYTSNPYKSILIRWIYEGKRKTYLINITTINKLVSCCFCNLQLCKQISHRQRRKHSFNSYILLLW